MQACRDLLSHPKVSIERFHFEFQYALELSRVDLLMEQTLRWGDYTAGFVTVTQQGKAT